MPIIRSAPLTADLSGFGTSEANGVQVSGSPPPPVAGRVEIGMAPDGAPCLHARCYQGDTLTVGGLRSEIAMVADAFNAPIWYVWEMWIPSSWPRTGHPYTVMQIHDTPDAGNSVVVWPNIEMMVQDSSLLIKVPNDASNKGVSASRDLLTVPVKFNQWIKCAVLAHWRKDATGYFEIYYDNQLVDRRYGIQSAYSDTVGPYLKLGVYDCLHYDDFGILEAYYKNCVVRDGADGAIAAIGTTPKSAQRRFAYSLPLKN